jgi:hypothetical protein
LTNTSILREGVPERKYAPGDILSRVKISQVYKALTGIEPRRTGLDTRRGPATWRGGDGHNVAMDDSRGVWHDFRDDSGGGVLDLIVRVRGGSRSDALRWLADFVGVHLTDYPLPPADRARRAQDRAELERTLPTAQHWRRAAVEITEELLSALKAALSDRSMEPIIPGEIASVHHFLQSLQGLDGASLMAQYQWWAEHHPGLTAALVRAAQTRERAERRALLRYLRVRSAPWSNPT